MGRADKGIILTTGTFTKDARGKAVTEFLLTATASQVPGLCLTVHFADDEIILILLAVQVAEFIYTCSTG